MSVVDICRPCAGLRGVVVIGWCPSLSPLVVSFQCRLMDIVQMLESLYRTPEMPLAPLSNAPGPLLARLYIQL
jgi:hypothetical protein